MRPHGRTGDFGCVGIDGAWGQDYGVGPCRPSSAGDCAQVARVSQAVQDQDKIWMIWDGAEALKAG